MQCRGRIQVHETNNVYSEPWAQDSAPTVSDGLLFLETLLSKIPSRFLRDLEEPIALARRYIRHCGDVGGVDHHVVGPSYRARRSRTKGLRIDIEFSVGKAFVPDTEGAKSGD